MAKISKKTQKKKVEFSKVACTIAFILFAVLGVWMVIRYYNLVEIAIASETGAMPDSSLPVAGITFMLAPLVSYLTYQAGLKNSRNKYGVDDNGEPYKRNIEQGE